MKAWFLVFFLGCVVADHDDNLQYLYQSAACFSNTTDTYCKVSPNQGRDFDIQCSNSCENHCELKLSSLSECSQCSQPQIFGTGNHTIANEFKPNQVASIDITPFYTLKPIAFCHIETP